MKIFLYILLAIIVFVTAYCLILIILEFKKRRYINDFIGNLSKNSQERQRIRDERLLYEGVTKDKRFIDKIDELVDKSGIKVLFPSLTSELFIIFSTLIAIVGAYIFNIYYPFWLYTMTVFISILFMIILVLKYMARRTYNKIDDQILFYINTLLNLSTSNDDIVTMFEKSIPYLKIPLKEYTQQFVFECKKGIPIQKAFDNFKDKVESKRFKQLLSNLSLCAKHDANYKEILNKSRIIMKHYFMEKERRRKEIIEGRVTIFATVVMGFFLIKIVSGLNSTLAYSLKTTQLGNILMGYNLLVLMYAVYKFITLDKLNY